jgi:ABC-2 type transport system permease protein
VRRWPRILWEFVRTSLAAELEYRINFVLAVLSSFGHLVGNIFALGLFYRGSASLGGWPFAEALLVMGLFTTLQGYSRMLLSPNLSRIVQHIRQGTLDFVLLKPIDAQVWLSFRHVSPWGLPDFLFGLGVVTYAAVQLKLGVLALGLGLLTLMASAVLQYALWFALASLSVWYVQIYNVTEVLNALLAAGRYPRDALPAGAYRFVFTFVVPAALLTTVPARVVLGRDIGVWPAFLLLFAGAALVASRLLFQRALGDYTSASS